MGKKAMIGDDIKNAPAAMISAEQVVAAPEPAPDLKSLLEAGKAAMAGAQVSFVERNKVHGEKGETVPGPTYMQKSASAWVATKAYAILNAFAEAILK